MVGFFVVVVGGFFSYLFFKKGFKNANKTPKPITPNSVRGAGVMWQESWGRH